MNELHLFAGDGGGILSGILSEDACVETFAINYDHLHQTQQIIMGIDPNHLPLRYQRQLNENNNSNSRLRSFNPKPDERMPLDDATTREETRWYDASKKFEIVFTVYALRPCDWDGYDVKALQDFCVAAGIISDDGWKTLSGRVVSRKAATKNEEKTVIEITTEPL
jgi:hypothetical protein